MVQSIFDSTSQNANIENGNIQRTIYDRKTVFQLKAIPIDTQVKKETFTSDFPIKIVGDTLTIERDLLEIGLFYSLKHNNEELLIKKTVDGKIQIFEVLE